MFKRITITLLAMLMLAAMATTTLAGKDDNPGDTTTTGDVPSVFDEDVTINANLTVGGTFTLNESYHRIVMNGLDKSLHLSGGDGAAPGGGLIAVRGVNATYNAHGIDFWTGGRQTMTLNKDGNLGILGSLSTSGNFAMGGNDLSFGSSDRGEGGRAIVHDGGDMLTINFASDFAGGVKINGPTTILGGLSVDAVLGGLSVGGNLTMSGDDFIFGTSTRGNGGRALVHDANDGLTINYANDFAGGVKIASGLSVLGNGTFTGTVTTGSSRELKNEISRLNGEDAVKALMELVPVQYTYKTNSDELELGFIAEDVPDLVARNDRKSLSPMDFATLSVTVIQEQQKEINEQRELLKLLLDRINALEAEKSGH